MRIKPFSFAIGAMTALLLGCPPVDDTPKCTDNDECDASRPYCNSDGTCVECIETIHCDDGYICANFACMEEEPPTEGCEHHHECPQDGALFCDAESGECVECLEDEHCDAEDGQQCVNNICREEYECDIVGLDLTRQNSDDVYYSGCYHRHLTFYGSGTRDSNGMDMIIIEMIGCGEYDPTYTPGTYLIGEDTIEACWYDQETCSICVFAGHNCSIETDECEGHYFAVSGELVIDEIGEDDGDVFAGALRDVLLEQLDLEGEANEDYFLSDGNLWCIEEMRFSTYLNTECTDATDCPDELPVCDHIRGACVECVESTDCPGDDSICSLSECVDVALCYAEGFSVEEQEAYAEVEFDMYSIQYQAEDADGNILRIIPLSSTSPLSTGTHSLGVFGMTVTIEENCDHGDCKAFSSISGNMILEEIGYDEGDVFSGVLENVFLQKTRPDSFGGVEPVPGGEIWCIDEMDFSVSVSH